MPPPGPDQAYARYLEALLQGDRKRCRDEFEARLASGAELRSLYQDLLQRSLYDVGVLWEQGRITVATEHLATAITESMLTLAYPKLFAGPRVDRSAVVACTANEYHQIGGKMVADLFELSGWRGYFLGANTPLQGLLSLLKEKLPYVTALSVTVSFGLESLVNAAEEIRGRYPAMPILVGGQALEAGEPERLQHIPGLLHLPTLAALESWIKSHNPDAN
jgi:methanogenic corrinoid protein MtbC1